MSASSSPDELEHLFLPPEDEPMFVTEILVTNCEPGRVLEEGHQNADIVREAVR
jgi:hypothetical protein